MSVIEATIGRPARRRGAAHRGLELGRMKLGLEMERVDAGFDEQPGRLGVGVLDQRSSGVPPSGRVSPVGPRLPTIGRPGAAVAGERDRGEQEVALIAIGETEAGQPRAGAAEAVGLDHLGAGGDVGGVDRAHVVGALEVPRLGALLAHTEPAGDELGAHRAVQSRGGYVRSHPSA